MVVETWHLADRAPSDGTTTELSRLPAAPIVYIRPRSAAALVSGDGDPGPGRVERLLQLARDLLP